MKTSCPSGEADLAGRYMGVSPRCPDCKVRLRFNFHASEWGPSNDEIVTIAAGAAVFVVATLVGVPDVIAAVLMLGVGGVVLFFRISDRRAAIPHDWPRWKLAGLRADGLNAIDARRQSSPEES